jgi:ethanolamine permease
VILNMAVFGAVIAYAMQMIAFIVLRRRYPHIARPYRSPLGTPGAWTALAISLVTLVLLFANADFRPGVIGVAIWFVAGLVYFALVGRHRLVLSPEEAFALTQGAHGLPQVEGVGHTRVADT